MDELKQVDEVAYVRFASVYQAFDDAKEPRGRIGNTRKLLLTAAVTMSLYLICSSVVVACLVRDRAAICRIIVDPCDTPGG